MKTTINDNTTKIILTRLAALPQSGSRLSVDRSFPGRIRNVSILTTGPALGHGCEIDKTTVEQVAAHATGIRGRWTHGGLSEDGLGRHFGTWTRVRVEPFRLCRACEAESSAATCSTCGGAATEEWRAVGDYDFAASAYRLRPDGLAVPAPVYLMDRALEDPSSLGISIIARLSHEEKKGEGESAPSRRLARLSSSATCAAATGWPTRPRTPSACTRGRACPPS